MSTDPRVLMLAVDNTDDDVRACRWVVANLLRPGDSLHLVHIIPRFTYASQYGGLETPAPLDIFSTDNDKAAYEDLLKTAESFLRDKFVSLFKDLVLVEPIIHLIKSEVDTEAIGRVICSKADDLNPAAVVLAKHTKGLLKEWFIGSVCKYCTVNCKCTVIVAHG